MTQNIFPVPWGSNIKRRKNEYQQNRIFYFLGNRQYFSFFWKQKKFLWPLLCRFAQHMLMIKNCTMKINESELEKDCYGFLSALRVSPHHRNHFSCPSYCVNVMMKLRSRRRPITCLDFKSQIYSLQWCMLSPLNLSQLNAHSAHGDPIDFSIFFSLSSFSLSLPFLQPKLAQTMRRAQNRSSGPCT